MKNELLVIADTIADHWPIGAMKVRAAADTLERQHAALVKAVELIQAWHNMEVPEKQRSELWDIYWRNSPEMKEIREALEV